MCVQPASVCSHGYDCEDSILWDVTPRGEVEMYQTARYHVPEDDNFQRNLKQTARNNIAVRHVIFIVL